MVGLLMAGCALGAGCDQASLPTAPQDPVQAEVDTVRTATTRYQDVSVALADGFVPEPLCVSSPAGAMGVHYANPARMDGRLAIAEPEVLLYVPVGGGLKLVAVEYVLPILENGRPYFGAVAPANPGPTPRLFGQAFEGPMAGHNPSMPWHFDLHAWVWEGNPTGRFAQFNPMVACP
jgi:hypothetical protein